MGEKNLYNQVNLQDFEKEAVERLLVLLKFSDLKALAKEKKRFSRSNKERRRLATNIILSYGTMLLEDATRRKLIGKRAGFTRKKDIPQRWISGSESVKKFVSGVGFPSEYAGEKKSSNVSYKLLGRTERRQLQDFQKEVIGESLKRLETKGSRFIISMPTGSGKTLTAIKILTKYLQDPNPNKLKNIIWLAHTEELCAQAEKTFHRILSDLQHQKTYLFPLWNEHLDQNLKDLLSLGASKDNPFIMIATPLKLLNHMEGNFDLKDFLSKKTSLVTIDEAHRAGAKTYKKLINLLSEENEDISFMGLTATPVRGIGNNLSDIEKLKELFKDDLVIPRKTLGNTSEKMKQKLQELGFLSKVKKIKIDIDLKIPIDLRNCIRFLNEYNPVQIDNKLKRKSDNDKKRSAILKYLQKITIEPQSRFLYFGASKNDAKQMNLLLRTSQFRSASITSDTKDNKRSQILKDFSSGKIQFLCNCEVLTTGFDEPKIDHIIMARPTISDVLYEQMIGRGLRGEKFGGTKTCNILICDGLEFPEGSEYYRFWSVKTLAPLEKWSYEDLFLKTLILMIVSDSICNETEIQKLKDICFNTLNRTLTDEEIQKEICNTSDYINVYNENLHKISKTITEKQKSDLISKCSLIMASDNHIDEKETAFLRSIISILDSSQDN